MFGVFICINATDTEVVGRCPLAAGLFHVKTSDAPVTIKNSDETMCPTVSNSCCDDDTYKQMRVWWELDGAISFKHLWKGKIRTMWKAINEVNDVYLPSLVEAAHKMSASYEPTLACKNASDELIR